MVNEKPEGNVGLDALKDAIGAIGNAMAELAETSAPNHKIEEKTKGELRENSEIVKETTNNNLLENNSSVKEDDIILKTYSEDSAKPKESIKNVGHNIENSNDNGILLESVPDVNIQAKEILKTTSENDNEKVEDSETPEAENVEIVSDNIESKETHASIIPTSIDSEEKANNDVETEESIIGNRKKIEQIPIQDATMLVLTSEQPIASEHITKEDLGVDMCETGFENALCIAMNNASSTDDNINNSNSVQLPIETNVLISRSESVPEGGNFEDISLADDEVLVVEEIEEDEEESEIASLQSTEQPDKPKKKKKLRIFKKVKRGTKAAAYGVLFSAGAMVGGTLVGAQAIGHGTKTGVVAIGHGTKTGVVAIGQGTKSGVGFVADTTKEMAVSAATAVKEGGKAGAEFTSKMGNAVVDGTKAGVGLIADGTVKIAEGTKDTANSFAKASVGAVGDIFDGAKSGVELVAETTVDGAKFVANQTHKAIDSVEETARLALVEAIQATKEGAEFAGYGKPKSIGGPKTKLAIENKGKK